jgi:hypothetical protein
MLKRTNNKLKVIPTLEYNTWKVTATSQLATSKDLIRQAVTKCGQKQTCMCSLTVNDFNNADAQTGNTNKTIRQMFLDRTAPLLDKQGKAVLDADGLPRRSKMIAFVEYDNYSAGYTIVYYKLYENAVQEFVSASGFILASEHDDESILSLYTSTAIDRFDNMVWNDDKTAVLQKDFEELRADLDEDEDWLDMTFVEEAAAKQLSESTTRPDVLGGAKGVTFDINNVGETGSVYTKGEAAHYGEQLKAQMAADTQSLDDCTSVKSTNSKAELAIMKKKLAENTRKLAAFMASGATPQGSGDAQPTESLPPNPETVSATSAAGNPPADQGL